MKVDGRSIQSVGSSVSSAVSIKHNTLVVSNVAAAMAQLNCVGRRYALPSLRLTDDPSSSIILPPKVELDVSYPHVANLGGFPGCAVVATITQLRRRRRRRLKILAPRSPT